jgi:hypothetical protein
MKIHENIKFNYDLDVAICFYAKDSAHLDEIADALGPDANITRESIRRGKTVGNYADVTWVRERCHSKDYDEIMMAAATYLASRRERLLAIMPCVREACFYIGIFGNGWPTLLLKAETLEKLREFPLAIVVRFYLGEPDEEEESESAEE